MKAQDYCPSRDLNLPMPQVLIVLKLEVMVGRHLYSFLGLNILSNLGITNFSEVVVRYVLLFAAEV